MFGVADMQTSTAATGAKAAVGIERVVECGHQLLREAPCRRLQKSAIAVPSPVKLTECRKHLLRLEKDHLIGPRRRVNLPNSSMGNVCGMYTRLHKAAVIAEILSRKRTCRTQGHPSPA
jgi:hypothetical protein